MPTIVLTFPQQDQALTALRADIDRLRERLANNVSLTGSPFLTPDRSRRVVERAHHCAAELRHAEHAYRQCGGLIDEYLPATARQPFPKAAA